MTLLDRVVGLLNVHQVPHALIGAAALAARGDVRELLRLPGADRLIADVAADLADHPQSMRDLWAEARR